VEFDADAAQTLRLNFHEGTVIEHADIATLKFDHHRVEADELIVIGGPPCQPFSKNGYWVKYQNRLVEADPRNMLSQFLRVVAQPIIICFTLVNVESMLLPMSRQALDAFVTAPESFGDKCTVTPANTADHGVPLCRNRVFLLGTR